MPNAMDLVGLSPLLMPRRRQVFPRKRPSRRSAGISALSSRRRRAIAHPYHCIAMAEGPESAGRLLSQEAEQRRIVHLG